MTCGARIYTIVAVTCFFSQQTVPLPDFPSIAAIGAGHLPRTPTALIVLMQALLVFRP